MASPILRRSLVAIVALGAAWAAAVWPEVPVSNQSRAAAPPAAAAQGRADSPARHGWVTDYARGLAEARRTSKPVMLVFRCVP